MGDIDFQRPCPSRWVAADVAFGSLLGSLIGGVVPQMTTMTFHVFEREFFFDAHLPAQFAAVPNEPKIGFYPLEANGLAEGIIGIIVDDDCAVRTGLWSVETPSQ